MPGYDPDDPNNKKGAGGPIAGQLRDTYQGMVDRGEHQDSFFLADAKTGRDVSDSLGQMFYGNNERPGIMGGTYQVNPKAWWEVGSMPYTLGAMETQARGPTFNGVPQDQSRTQQQSLIQMLQRQAMGQGPSLAQGQLQQATDRNIAQSMAMSASGRGPGAAGGAYQANNMAAMANQQAAADSAQLRMQEQLQTQGLLGSVLGQTRGMDQNMIQAQMQDQKMRDDMVMQFMKMGYDADQANREAAMKMEELKMKAFQGGEGGGGFFGGLFSALGGK